MPLCQPHVYRQRIRQIVKRGHKVYNEIALAIGAFFRYNLVHQIYTQQLLMNNSTSG